MDPQIERRLRHMYDAGAWVLLESAIADLPADLRWLFESGAVTIEQLATLHGALGVTTIADLAAAVEQQAVQRVPGLDAAIERAVIDALGGLRAAIPRIPLGLAMAIADPILDHLRSFAGIEWAVPAGSLRRGQDTVGDIEVIAAAVDPAAAIEALPDFSGVVRPLQRSSRRLYLLLDRAQVGIRFPEPAKAGAMLLHLTGSAAHFDQLRARAAERGWRLDPEGLHAPDGALKMAATEEEIYAALDLPFIPPEIRNGDDELSVAGRGALSALISRSDIRGDLHMHSLWSDGRDSIEAMVTTCRSLGYEYLAITDHSPHSPASRKLSVDSAKRQADEVAALRQQFPDITILHGCEVDIGLDGQLDFPDRLLERFDIVLASLHERAGQSRDQLLGRYVSAMRHPLVTLIAHPTNRVVALRAGYDLDYDRLFATAVETGTALEIDGAPVHLDMDGGLARRAIAVGVTVAIDSDAHRAETLGRQMNLGIVTARRGWVEPRHVLNAQPLADVREFVARKRRG